MGRLLIKFVGLSLLIIGIYFFGQNIIFVSGYSTLFYRGLPATASSIAIILGIFALVFFRRETGNLGWILLGVGTLLIFLSGGIIFQPTSLWNLFVAFASLAVGFKLLNQGRINF